MNNKYRQTFVLGRSWRRRATVVVDCRPSIVHAIYVRTLAMLLRRQRERWRSIIMSTSVRVSVCLSASISPEPRSRSLQIFCACCL